jgi:hypothetical protein
MYRRLVIWTAIVAGVCVATDWPFGDLLGVDWEDHSLWAGVLTGGLLLVAGSFGVESYLRERDTHRWRQVANVGFKAMGLSGALLRDGMDRLLAADRHLALRRQPLTPALREALAQRFRELNVEHGTAAARERNLGALVGDPQWARLAVEGLDQLKWQHREVLGHWAPLMLANDRLAEDFTRLAALNEMVSALQRLLRERGEVYVRDEPKNDDPERASRAIVALWCDIIMETIVLQEDFMRAAGERAWTHVLARNDLSDTAREELEERDRRYKSGDHAPEEARVPEPAVGL